jgi:hypothetical protein
MAQNPEDCDNRVAGKKLALTSDNDQRKTLSQLTSYDLSPGAWGFGESGWTKKAGIDGFKSICSE